MSETVNDCINKNQRYLLIDFMSFMESVAPYFREVVNHQTTISSALLQANSVFIDQFINPRK